MQSHDTTTDRRNFLYHAPFGATSGSGRSDRIDSPDLETLEPRLMLAAAPTAPVQEPFAADCASQQIVQDAQDAIEPSTQDVRLGEGGVLWVAYTDGDGTRARIFGSDVSAALRFAGDNLTLRRVGHGVEVGGTDVRLDQIDVLRSHAGSSLGVNAAGGADDAVTLGALNGRMPLGGFHASDVDVLGGIHMTGDGFIRACHVGDVGPGAEIAMAGTGATGGVVITAAEMGDGTTVSLGSPLAMLRAWGWLGGWLRTPFANRIVMTGNGAEGVEGHFGADATFTGADANGLGLAMMFVAGSILGSQLRLLAGSVGSITAGQWDRGVLQADSANLIQTLRGGADFDMNLAGQLRSLCVLGILAGALTARYFGTIHAQKDMTADVTATGADEYGYSLRMLSAGQVGGSARLSVDALIHLIRVGQWARQQGRGPGIRAGGINTLLVTEGDFAPDVALSGEGVPRGWHTFGHAYIAGRLLSRLWSIAGSLGRLYAMGGIQGTADNPVTLRTTESMGAVVADSFEHTNVLAGVNEDVRDHAAAYEDFVNPSARIGAVTALGLRDPRGISMSSSHFSAPTFGHIRIVNPDVEDILGGDLAFYCCDSPGDAEVGFMSYHDRINGVYATYPSNKFRIPTSILKDLLKKLHPAQPNYITYLGDGADYGSAVAVDGSGNIYITGDSLSPGLATPGAYDTSHNGGMDAFVAKFNTDGTLGYYTYLGGTQDDGCFGIAVDAAGNAYVTGLTRSAGLATSGAHDTSYNGWEDAFAAKLSSDGSALEYLTYLGGADDDCGTGIAVDSAGNAYVTGHTRSSGWATSGAYGSTYFGTGGECYDVPVGDAFVAKLNATGSAMLYCSYLGGAGGDYAKAIAVDAAGDAYVTGWTNSSGWATSGAYDTSYNGTAFDEDVFVAKLNASGSALDYCTYLGGSSTDCATGIAVDAAGSAYVTGVTYSASLATFGAHDTSYNGQSDGFVAKLNAAGSGLGYFTYLGGSGYDANSGIAVDAGGCAYVTGGTTSAGLATLGAHDGSFNGVGPSPGDDPFVAKLTSSGGALSYYTYLGGADWDGGTGIAVDGAGNACVSGYTRSAGWATPGAHDTTHTAGTYDAFVARIAV